MKQTFRLPVEFVLSGYRDIEADTIEQAIQLVQNAATLPSEASYLDESFKLSYEDYEIIENAENYLASGNCPKGQFILMPK